MWDDEKNVQAQVAAWLADHPRVTASRTQPAFPEVWEGTVDGVDFRFSERSDVWYIEIRSDDVIAQGVADDDLGETPIGHLAFIVREVRDHLRREACTHPDAREWCPDCGARMEGTG